MITRYDGEHSIDLYPYNHNNGDYLNNVYNTWVYFSLIPDSRPYIVPPSFTNEFIQPELSNSIIDFTKPYANKSIYGQCSGQWSFIIDHSRLSTNAALARLESKIHGNVCMVKIKGDDLFYKGRVYISDIQQEDEYTSVTLSYILKPTVDIPEVIWNEESSGGGSGGGGGSSQSENKDIILSSDPKSISTGWRLVRSGYGLPTSLYDSYKSGTTTYYYYIIPGSTVRLTSKVSNTSYAYLIRLYTCEKNSKVMYLTRLNDNRYPGGAVLTKVTSDYSNTYGHLYSVNYSNYFKLESSKNNSYRDVSIGIKTTETNPNMQYQVSYFIYALNSNTNGT